MAARCTLTFGAAGCTLKIGTIGTAGCTLKIGSARCTLLVGAAGCTEMVGAARCNLGLYKIIPVAYKTVQIETHTLQIGRNLEMDKNRWNN